MLQEAARLHKKEFVSDPNDKRKAFWVSESCPTLTPFSKLRPPGEDQEEYEGDI